MGRIKTVFSTIWTKIKQHPARYVLLALGIVGASILLYSRIALGMAWADETGFGGYWITRVDPSTNTIIEKEIHYRTWWDWLELLIIPAVLAGGAYWFNRSERNNDREIALDRQRETALQTYIDRMTELLLREKDGLRDSKQQDEIRTITRTRTLTTLQALDGYRKGILVQFLYEAKLIQKINTTISMSRANLNELLLTYSYLNGVDLSFSDLEGANFSVSLLSEANLKGVNLRKAKLSETDLGNANLSGANLVGADLSYAYLNGANLTGANLFGASLVNTDLDKVIFAGADLSRADLSKANINLTRLVKAKSLKGATMPDGSKHE